jgi:thiamine-phosphate pyrophosphorylase
LPTPSAWNKHQLHLVTESRRGFDDLVRAVAMALDGGVDWVQLRDKSASAASLYTQARQLLTVTRQHGARLSINDRLDVALAAEADGVHLAGQSLPVGEAVRLAAQRVLVGRSVHSLDEAIAAAGGGADYVTFGHVFPTTTHPGLPPHGLAELQAIVDAVDVPVLAIGGIAADNIEDVLSTGCAGVAVISAILSDADPCRAASRLRRALDSTSAALKRPFPIPQRRHRDAAHHQPTAV